MKTLTKHFIMAIIALFSLSSCDDSLLDITEDFSFQHEFIVLSEDPAVNITDAVNLADKVSLINEYGSKIKKAELQQVRYWLKAHNGSAEQKVTTLTLNVANTNGADSKNIIQLQDRVLAGLLYTPTELDANAAGIEKLSDLISSNPHSFIFEFNTSVNETPADFTVVFEFDMTMTANPIN